MTSPLQEILETINLATTAGPNQFSATAIPDFPNHFVGRNSSGEPCILIKTSDNGFQAPLKLAALEIQFCIPCEVVPLTGSTEHRQFSVLTCTSPDAELRSYFLHLMDTIIRIIGPRPSLHMLSEAIGKLVEILQQLAKPARRSVIGLFAELTIIALSKVPTACVMAWRSGADHRFDFALEDARLEVKATSDRVRTHHFSLEQCTPSRGTHAIVASMFVEPNGAGQSLGDLLDDVGQRLEGNMQALLKLRTVVANALGSALPTALQMRFDNVLARATLAFFRAEDIPAIRDAIPHGVSSVKFRSDLTGVSALSPQNAGVACAALSFVLPIATEPYFDVQK
ncbi:MAG: PD-(D/E)XK motif protein [Rhizobiales bacterium]|nr:PD-(D/E)XK motif protein [Hyphomicrobiales bacterium]